jgi:hypothetical protein
MSLEFAFLGERTRPYTTVPCAAKPIFTLVQVLDMLVLAVVLKFLVASKLFGTENTVFAKPLASEIWLSLYGLALGQFNLRGGRKGGYGKPAVLAQSQTTVTTHKVAVMFIKTFRETMAKIVGKISKIMADCGTDV